MESNTSRIVAVSFDDRSSFTIHLRVHPSVGDGTLYLRLGMFLMRAIQNEALANDGIVWAWAEETQREIRARRKRIRQLLQMSPSTARVPGVTRRGRMGSARRPAPAQPVASISVPDPE